MLLDNYSFRPMGSDSTPVGHLIYRTILNQFLYSLQHPRDWGKGDKDESQTDLLPLDL
jgi:hypothetical protein